VDLRAYNRHAWDRNVEKQNRWTIPVGPEAIARARAGHLEILLTPVKTVPSHWLGQPAWASLPERRCRRGAQAMKKQGRGYLPRLSNH